MSGNTVAANGNAFSTSLCKLCEEFKYNFQKEDSDAMCKGSPLCQWGCLMPRFIAKRALKQVFDWLRSLCVVIFHLT